MKVRINWVCKAKSKKADYEAENIYIDLYPEVLPPIGSFIQVHEDGCLGKVEDIYIELFKRDSGVPPIFIYLEEPSNEVDLRPWPEMKQQGWKIDSGLEGGAA